MTASTDGRRRTRVLVAPHNFELGGSQINALELVGEIAKDPGYEVILYAPDGLLVERARSLGVELHLTRLKESAPSMRRILELRRLIRARGIDLVHTYEWMPTVDAAFASGLGSGVPVVSTILSMDYPYFVPTRVPLILGTQGLVDRATAEGRSARLIEPPVDVAEFRPGACTPDEIAEARTECGVEPGGDLIVVVGRLSQLLKLEGLLTLIEAVQRVGTTRPITLAVVGDGAERATVQAAADRANAGAGRALVRLLGAREDPLRYYLAADIAVGMGGSALRAMAVGKPLLVQGEQGFWAAADEDTLPMFLQHGWYGIGDGTGAADRCATELGRILALDAAGRAARGRFGRQLVEERYSLNAAGRRLAAVYAETAAAPRPSRGRRMVSSVALAAELVKARLAIRFPAIPRAMRALRGAVPIGRPEPSSSARPRVSVVIPCYNYEAYLDAAVASALNQDGVDVDVTVVDDASTDASRAIAEHWAARDDRVRVIVHERNRGHIETFNEALDAATAPYVVKLDADDVLTHGSLRRSAAVLDAHPEVVFVYGGVEHVRGPMPLDVDTRVRGWRIRSGNRWIALVARRRARNPISQPEIMVRRSALEKAGGHRAEVPGTSDLLLWLRLASHGEVAVIRGAVQGLYRIHDASMRATIHSGLLLDVRARRAAFELFLSERGERLDGSSRLARTVRRSLGRDAVTNAYLDYENHRDPRPLLTEAVAIDPLVTRSPAYWILAHHARRGWRHGVLLWAGHVGRDVAARLRWRRHRWCGV